jgi:hypothetical protein
MNSNKQKKDLSVAIPGTKRCYSTPLLKSFGDWNDLTLGGGAVVAADPGGGNTKSGR